MLFVLFQLGNDRYALEASQVVEVIPLVALRKLPQSPKGIAGFFVYRGQPVPAVDLGELLLGKPARERLSTRIIVVNNADAPGAAPREISTQVSPESASRQTISRGEPRKVSGRLGLIAERATATMKSETMAFKGLGVPLAATPWLGPVLTDEKGVIQLVQPRMLSGLMANIRETSPEPASEAGHVAH